MNEADRREKTMLDLFDWITDFVAGRDDVTHVAGWPFLSQNNFKSRRLRAPRPNH